MGHIDIQISSRIEVEMRWRKVDSWKESFIFKHTQTKLEL